MPCFNEEEGIENFLSEILDAFHAIRVQIRFIVVDDKSTDGTFLRLQKWKIENAGLLTIIQNEVNSGHGYSTLVGLRSAASILAENVAVISVDGDGQFMGKDIADLYKEFEIGGIDILEGVRVNRKEPFFRKVVSLITRMMVRARVQQNVKDANTPLRIYKIEVLKSILDKLPQTLLTPNLHISSIARTSKLVIQESEIAFFQRRGSDPTGTMWRSKSVRLPSKRFLKFCRQAFSEWFLIKTLRE